MKHARGPRKLMLLAGFAILIMAVLAGCAAPASAPAEEGTQSTGDKITISIAPGAYYPTEPTADNPNPPTALNELVAEYEAANPNVEIELIEIPQSVSEDTWRVTVFQGGTEPHIINNNYIRVWQEEGNGWYVPLNDYIEQPNPYIPEGTPGHEQWQESIPEVVWDTTLHSSGNQYLTTVDAVAVGYFYNKEIFEELGLPTEFVTETSLWTDWADMMEDMAVIQEAGYEPLALSMSTATPFNYNWIDGVTLTSLYRDKIESMWEPDASWHALNQKEMACAIQNGIMSANDPEFSAWIDVLSAYEPYWIEGYSSATPDEAYRLFITGETPIMLANAAVDMSRVLRDSDFEFGVSYFPPLQETTSEFASNVDTAYLVGGFTAGYAVTDRAQREGITDEVVDFLMYLTAQPQWSRVVSDAPRSVPTLLGLDVPEALQPLAAFLDLPIRALKDPDPRLTKRYGEEHRRLMQEYFTDQISKDELIAAEDRLMTSEAEKVIAENDWTCDFQLQ